ncbi:MAG: ATP-dependent DNA ligase, partial [Gemmatimonadaceae bacterium]|nr:ATP-dependent DNA ligase [Gemmatimonadaceae bacterium]
MRDFARLFDAIDQTTSTSGKVAALVAYFHDAPTHDAAWAASFLLGRRPKRLVRAPDVRRWAAAAADIPDWLFEECYAQVGDLAETIALLIPDPDPDSGAVDAGDETSRVSLAWWVEQQLLPLAGMTPDYQRAALMNAWARLGGTARFVFNKLITGAFRVGVSDGLVVRALAQVSGISAETIAHRLMGQWEPSAAWY